jgi:uncharacterized membrane-anchored protein YitT (DUF2179 family)
MDMKNNFIKYFNLVLGCFLMAISINCFLVQDHFLSGGLAGLCMIFLYLFGWPVGITSLILNIPLFLLAYRFMSKRFLVDSFFGTVIFSVILDATAFLSQTTYVDNPLLACIAGGVTEGIGAALIYRVDGSTGGIDILGFLFKKYKNISISTAVFIFNAIVVAAAIVFVGLEPVLYSMVIFYISFKATNFVMVGFDYKKSVIIISQHNDVIGQRIMDEVNRGITLIHGQGGYTKRHTRIILVVVKLTQLNRLTRIVNEVDPAAFMLVQDANDVFGRGFTQPDLILPLPEEQNEQVKEQ